ncbi:hypothetical protein Taro_039171 [Colocasia esculenta]|uniref:EamA domain-containing protein n=1 Tax=Colocasia esculenta TaxID=4460 RepID=A0A843WUW9_COLES|nr:hypothetical protein [Colocasia esculenta]
MGRRMASAAGVKGEEGRWGKRLWKRGHGLDLTGGLCIELDRKLEQEEEEEGSYQDGRMYPYIGSRCWEEWSPVAAMLAVDVAFAIMNTLMKKTVDEGVNCLVFITLRQFTATIFMAPIAYYRERESRPKLTPRILFCLFFSALLGLTLTQYLFFTGLRYTSATFACAFLNMTPVVTFLIALPFRLETLDVCTKAGQAKVLGTAVCVGGAMMLTFYKGVALSHASGHVVRPAEPSLQAASPTAAGGSSGSRNWTIGTVALFGACFSWCSWFLLQYKVGKMYPALYSGTAIAFFLGFLQSAALTFATGGGPALFAVRGELPIISILFSGVVGSGVGFLVMSWCVKKRGPLFPAAFSPPVQIAVAIIEYAILHEQLHLGSVLGSVLVILGLYVLLWGKNKEVEVQKCEVQPVQGSLQGVEGIKEQV